jgi:hypothetical protein
MVLKLGFIPPTEALKALLKEVGREELDREALKGPVQKGP